MTAAAAMPGGTLPQLRFAIEAAEAVPYAAVPTLGFTLHVGADRPVHSLLLETQIRISATRRAYDAAQRERLRELFGEPDRFASSLRSLLWTHATKVVPGFSGDVAVELPVTCTYDLEVTATRYLDAVRDGGVPLEFLFSGTVFYPDEHRGLQAARISWEHEAAFRLPVAVWRETMDHYFPHSAWLRLGRESYDRLSAFRAARTLPTWDAAVDALLEARED
jgi:hypothetical protein